MKVKIKYYKSTQHPRKPYRVEFDIDNGDLSCTLDMHGRFKNQREAAERARNIACRLGEFNESWGRVVVEDAPPDITTID